MSSYVYDVEALPREPQEQRQQLAQPIQYVAPAMTAEDDDQLVEAMERLLSAETNRRILASSLSACREGSPAVASSNVGPLTASELDILSLCCTKITANSGGSNDRSTSATAMPHGFGAVDGDLLTTLTELLEKHVNLAVGVDLVQEAIDVIHKGEVKLDQWMRNGAPGSQRVTALKLGLEAAAILLFIVASPGVETRVVSEDAIEASFMLLRHHLSKNIIPALNNSGHLLASKKSDLEKGITSPHKRKRKSAAGEGNIGRELKKIYKPILVMMPLHLVLMGRIERAVQTIYLDDQQILALTSGAMKSLEIEAALSSQSPANQLQHATISLVASVFRKFPMHRSSIIEDLFPLMLKLPTAKKTMRAYHVRYTSCPSPDITKMLTTELFSSMLTNGAQPHGIQMITAMILSFVQCCVARPTFSSPQANNNDDYQDDNDEEDNMNDSNMHGKLAATTNQFESGLRGCQAVADSFANQLLVRCSRKGEDGGASEFRPILTNILEDLLLVLMLPEYHSSQMILLSLTHGLSRDVIIASQVSNSNTSDTVVESTYVNTAFDALGRISAAYAKLLAAQRSKELHTTIKMSSEENNEVRCYCKRNDYTKCLMIDCDNCHTWYHAKCVGIHRDTLPNNWCCDGCRFSMMTQQEQAATGHSNESRGIIDAPYIINRSVENLLCRKFPLAYKFQIASWTEELNKQSKSKGSKGYQHAIGQILERWDRSSPESIRHFGFTHEGGARALLSLTTGYSNFMKSFNALMGLLVKLMSDKAHASLRKQSIRAIEKVVDADPMLMLLPKVMHAVSQRLSDDSISVREAVVSLVGSYVVSSPVLANAFHKELIARLYDQGVSVRKRTVKILQDILCTNPHYKGRSDACDKCLQRAADPKEDDGVREALHALFMKLWLEDGDLYVASSIDITSPARNALPASPAMSPPGSAGGASTASGVVTPTPPGGTRSTRSHHKEIGKLRSDLAAEQMVAAVRIAGTNENLGNFMRELLCNVNDSDKGKKAGERLKRQKVAAKQCFNLVDALFELLLSTEERRSAVSTRVEESGQEILATVRTIGVFAEVSTASVMKQLATLLPYLKADNGLSATEESALASATADILYRVVPILDQQEIARLGQGGLAQDLVQITYKYGGALYSSMRALSSLAHHRDAGEDSIFGKKLVSLAKTFYAYLHKKEPNEEFPDASTKNNVKRLLSGLGSLCRHHEVYVETEEWNEEVEMEDCELFEPAEITWESIPVACFRLFSKYLEKADSEIKCSSLRALSGLFVQHPRLMLASAQSGLIEDVMSPDSPLELQMEALRCWKDISLAEEKNVDSGEAKKKMDMKSNITTSNKISGDQDGDSTLVGGVLTKQSARLFEMTQSKEAGLRMASLELESQLLRQGLLNPNEAVPYLLALQGDADMVVKNFALNLLLVEGEKRPDMLRQRVCAGIKQACRFQRQVYPSKEVSALFKTRKGHRIDTETIFDSLFKHCIISSKKQREGLYRNLIAMFERLEDDGNVKHSSSAKKARARRKSFLEESASTETDMSLLSFAAQILAYLPFNSVFCPLFIQHRITSIVALSGPLLQDRLAAFLRPYGLSSSDELDETNEEEDTLELAAKSSAPSRSKEASPLNAENFEWPAFIQLCKEASALALLLRLKTFLKRRYNLSDSRCMQYNPDSKEKSRGGFISRSDSVAPFDSTILSVGENSMIHGDEDRIIHSYCSFRQAMREEATIDEILDSDDDEEMPGVMKDDVDIEGEEAIAEENEKPHKRRSSAGGGSNRKSRKR